ncbi:MAG: hypothetical protein HYX52_03270 [Chloroflexi bacterium]|nr:hypothetical protein [Chloroflexota bacterium]
MPGVAIGSYLQVHPDAVVGSPEDLRSALGALGLNIADIAVVNLAANGDPEVATVLRTASGTSGWLTLRISGTYRSVLLTAPSLGVARFGTVPPAGAAGVLRAESAEGRVVGVVRIENGQVQVLAPDQRTKLSAMPTPGLCSMEDGITVPATP